MKYNYEWNLKDAVFTKDKGTVFSCFACGGGSTMGYKLAGFDVIGMNEIDPKMAACYIENHKPKYSFIEPIQDFKNRDDLPEELYNLDILDGSPPCSSFSMAGNRESDWGKEKKFREGQACQVLDDLFFHFIDLAKKLQSKIVIAENVKGLLLGDAKKYVTKILNEFDKAGYAVTYKLLNASKMGVPQKRERVFFIAIRKDLKYKTSDLFGNEPFIDLEFNENPILFKKIEDKNGRELSLNMTKIWEFKKHGDNSMEKGSIRFNGKRSYFSQSFLYPGKTPPTLTGHEDSLVLFNEPRYTSKLEVCKIGSFPFDYNFLKMKPHYVIGMSVPPVMTAKIADRVYKDIIILNKKIKKY